MRHNLSVVSHMMLNDGQGCYPLRSRQLGHVLFPRLSRSCGSCLPLLYQHFIKLRILILIDPLHILDQLWRIRGYVCVKSMGIEREATCILRRWTVHRGKIMLSFPSPSPSPSSVRMSVLGRNGLPLKMWCTMVRILSGMSVMWLPWDKKCTS
jgi:hypothetical protein